MKRLVLIFLLFGFSACNENDEDGGLLVITPGVYHSQCDISGADSKHYILTIEQNYDRTIEEITYTGVTNCSNAGNTVLIDAGSLSLSNVDLGGGVSYFIDSAEGGDATPFMFDGTVLYTSNSLDISAGASTVFADFIANPVSESELIYTLQP